MRPATSSTIATAELLIPGGQSGQGRERKSTGALGKTPRFSEAVGVPRAGTYSSKKCVARGFTSKLLGGTVIALARVFRRNGLGRAFLQKEVYYRVLAHLMMEASGPAGWGPRRAGVPGGAGEESALGPGRGSDLTYEVCGPSAGESSPAQRKPVFSSG